MINLSRSFLIVLGFVALVVVMLLGLSTGIAVTQSKAIAYIEDLSTQVANAEKTVTAWADADATATAISKDRAFALNDTISIGLQPTISVAIYGNFVAPSEIDLRGKSFTIAAWAKREGEGNFFIIGQGEGNDHEGLHFGFRGQDQTFTCGFWHDDVDIARQEDVGEWHHWACTVQVNRECRGETPCRTIYKDGKEVTTTHSGVPSDNYQGSGPLMIGNSPLQTNSEGSVAGVAVYDRVLNLEEIRSLMEMTRPPEVTPIPIE
jgi:hypothetical protein